MATKQTTTVAHVSESLTVAPDRVDREAGIIRDVKIVGLRSSNVGAVLGVPESAQAASSPYRYDADAMREAVPLYDGCRVFLDHPPLEYSAAGKRIGLGEKGTRDLFGQIISPRFIDGDGIRGDLQYLQADPLAAKLVEAIEKMPHVVALSHRAACNYRIDSSEAVVTKIKKVASVDLIAAEPGATAYLFESMGEQMDPEKCATEEMIESPAEETTETPADIVREGLVSAVMEIVSGDGTAAEKLAKIQPILEQMDSAAAMLGGEEPAQETPAEEPAAATEATAELARLRARDAATKALVAKGVKITDARIDAIATVVESARGAIIDAFIAQDGSKTAAVAEGVSGKGVVSKTKPASTWEPARDFKEFAARLR